MPPLSVAWAYVVLAALLGASAVTALRSGQIYNVVTYPAAALGLIGHTFFGGIEGRGECMGLWGALGGLAMGFFPMLLPWLAGGGSAGDAKLMGAVGALTGWRFALSALFYGLLVCLLMAVVVMVRKRVFRRTLLRVWRFLVLALAPKGVVRPTTADSPKVPMGVAFSLGAVAALVEVLLHRPGWLLRL
jgi:prepilin peptidase CpaA